jgi:hypothetical protein
MYLLSRVGGIAAQNKLWSYLENNLVTLYLPAADERYRIQELMNQYADMPLDLADASLVCAAERLGDRRLFSIDEPIRAVCMNNRQFFEIVP